MNSVLLRNGAYAQITKTNNPSLDYLAIQALTSQINVNLQASIDNLMVLVNTYNKLISEKFPDDKHLLVNTDKLKDLSTEKVVSNWSDNRTDEDVQKNLLARLKKIEEQIRELEG